MQTEFKDEEEMRATLARLGLSAEKIERAVETWRNRPHPSQRDIPPHPMKGKKRSRVLAKKNPAPGGSAGFDGPG
jgi:hypothetical protein